MEHQVGGKRAEEVFQDPRSLSLAKAACDGRRKEIDALVAAGANPNAAGLEGMAPLLWALTCENSDGMEALLKAGADPNQKAHTGLTPVLAAASYRNPSLLSLLLANGGDPDASDGGHWTALRESFASVVEGGTWDNYYNLLQAGADVNKPNGFGWGIAELAVSQARFDKAIELLERGYDFELAKLAELAQIRQVAPQSEQAVHKAALLAMLEARVPQAKD